MKALRAAYTIVATSHISSTMVIELAEPANFPAAFVWNNTIIMFYDSADGRYRLAVRFFDDRTDEHNRVSKYLMGAELFNEISARLDQPSTLASLIDPEKVQPMLDKIETGTIGKAVMASGVNVFDL